MSHETNCPACAGAGSTRTEPKCRTCNATGRLVWEPIVASNRHGRRACTTCLGTGLLFRLDAEGRTTVKCWACVEGEAPEGEQDQSAGKGEKHPHHHEREPLMTDSHTRARARAEELAQHIEPIKPFSRARLAGVAARWEERVSGYGERGVTTVWDMVQWVARELVAPVEGRIVDVEDGAEVQAAAVRWVESFMLTAPPLDLDDRNFSRAEMAKAFLAGMELEAEERLFSEVMGQRQLDGAIVLLTAARGLFRFYEQSHRAKAEAMNLRLAGSLKAKVDTLEKAERNKRIADDIGNYLADPADWDPPVVAVEMADDPAKPIYMRPETTTDGLAAAPPLPPAPDIPVYTSKSPSFGDPACPIDLTGIDLSYAGRTVDDCRAMFEGFPLVNTASPQFGYDLDDDATAYHAAKGGLDDFPANTAAEGAPIPVLWSGDGERPLAPPEVLELENDALRRKITDIQRKVAGGPLTQTEVERIILKESAAQGFPNVKPVTEGILTDRHLVGALAGARTTVVSVEQSLHTGDPRFDPTKPVTINGYTFTPATED